MSLVPKLCGLFSLIQTYYSPDDLYLCGTLCVDMCSCMYIYTCISKAILSLALSYPVVSILCVWRHLSLYPEVPSPTDIWGYVSLKLSFPLASTLHS